ncbi:hypothetical protein TWF730_007403 [Orbilia blumenaviensis]|uniref:Apple domain-containing protein n=1 Tax=Orbilia blumenaviensis TaxID=1796055 RepID=A0AAV9VAE8_9PEZI
MLFTTFMAVAAALIPLSESRTIPSSQIPGYKLLYTDLRALPNTGSTIQSYGEKMEPSTPATCASMCTSLPSCKFFAIYTPFDGSDYGHKTCRYYSEADPYQKDDGTQFTHQVKELCGYQKDRNMTISQDPTERRPTHERRGDYYNKAGEVPTNVTISPPKNCTNATSAIVEEQSAAKPIPYYPNQDRYQENKPCGLACRGYKALRSIIAG